jgi:hypothetical protein
MTEDFYVPTTHITALKYRIKPSGILEFFSIADEEWKVSGIGDIQYARLIASGKKDVQHHTYRLACYLVAQYDANKEPAHAADVF